MPQIRIDNPTSKQLRKGDTVYFKPATVTSDGADDHPYVHFRNDTPVSRYDVKSRTRSLSEVAYITREQTLEVGDEIEWKLISTFSVKVVAIAAGHYMVQHVDGSCGCYTLEYLKKYDYKITKKHNS